MIAPMLDHNSPIPLYHQLKEIFNAKIESGEWAVGQLIPTESELIDYYRVSRTTVREAINALVSEGKLAKKQGVGTTVCKPQMEERLGRLTGFTEEMQNKGITPGAVFLESRKIVPPRQVKERLFNGEDRQTLYVKRLRLANGEPIAIERSYWPIEVAALFEGHDLSDIAFYTILEQNGVYLREADEMIKAKSATKEEAALLGIHVKDPMLAMERVTLSTGGIPIEYTFTNYRFDRYIYRVLLKR